MIKNRDVEGIICKEKDITNTIVRMYWQTGLTNNEIKSITSPYISLYNEDLINLNQLFDYVEEEIEKRILCKNIKMSDTSIDEINDYSYLIEEAMSDLSYDSSLTMDLYNDGYLILISTLNEHKKNGMDVYKANLKRKLKNGLERKIEQYTKESIPKENKQNDFNDIIETKDTINNIMYNMMSESKLTLLQKTVLFVCLKAESFEDTKDKYDSFLSKLTKNSSNSNQSIYETYKKALCKIRDQYKLETINKYTDSDFSLFRHIRCRKEIVMTSFIDGLNTDETDALKLVWGEDFSKLKNFDEILMNEKQLLDYASAIRKLYDNIKRMDRDEEFSIDLTYKFLCKKHEYNCVDSIKK